MQRNQPKNDARFEWTHHVVEKMRYYGLSEGRVRRVIYSPKRIEEGVAPGTVAVMQPSTGAKNRYEVWVMYQELGKNKELRAKNKAGKRGGSANALIHNSKFLIPARKRIITAWRYPGVSKPRGPVPIPDEVMAELAGEFSS